MNDLGCSKQQKVFVHVLSSISTCAFWQLWIWDFKVREWKQISRLIISYPQLWIHLDFAECRNLMAGGLLGVSWSKGTLKDLASMKNCKGALTKKVQCQICQSRGGAGHGEIPMFFSREKLLLDLIHWPESSAEGLDWNFCKLLFSWFPTSLLREGFKYFSAHCFAFNTSFV